MAEEYYVGTNKIIYKSMGFKTELVVTVDIYCLEEIVDHRELKEIGEGLYCFDYKFIRLGMYTGIFYENNVKSIAQNFRVIMKPKGIISGNNLINI